jgi:hypothetical protein
MRIAVGFYDTVGVAVVSGRDLTPLYRADTGFSATGSTQTGNLGSVTWSQDGDRLYAAGNFIRGGDRYPIVQWQQQGQGPPALFDSAPDSIMDLVPMAHGRLAFASGPSFWGVLGPDGRREQTALPDLIDFSYREDRNTLRLSPDGARIEFGYHVWDGSQSAPSLARFDLTTRTFETGVSPAAAGLTPTATSGLAVTDWSMSTAPKLNGQPLTVLDNYERSRALSIAEDRSGFVLGSDWHVASLDASGQVRWRQPVPGTAWIVNQSGDGRFIVAALGDGTIRWYEAATGRERLALFVHSRDHRWVLFTPEGFYQASPGGDALLGYQLNQGPEHEGQFVDSAQLSTVFFRPDLITARLSGNETAITAAVNNIGDVRTVFAGGLPPTVTLLSDAVAESASGEYALKVRITPGSPGARVGGLQLAVNGAAVQPHAIAPAGGGVVTERLSLGPGPNTVSLRALRADGKVASSEVAARVMVRPFEAQPVLRILSVGISRYDDASFGGGVTFAAGDAAELARQLKSQAGGMYRDVDERVLTRREDTSLARIEAEIQGLVSRSHPADVVVIYLAGHGKASGGQYHFIPADFIYGSDAAFEHGGTLSSTQLEGMLKSLGAGRRLLILDTCDAGSVAYEGDQNDALARLMHSTGRYILAGASPLDKALEVHGHGAYTAALLEGLSGGADPRHAGVIEVDALAEYVARRVPELTGGAQHPMRSSYGENFPIVLHPRPAEHTASP